MLTKGVMVRHAKFSVQIQPV